MLPVALVVLVLLGILLKPLRLMWYVIHVIIVVGVSYYLEVNHGYGAINKQLILPLLCVHLVSINFVTFITYAYDKAAAIEGKWRVPEKSLHALALIGGTPSAIFSRKILRHKTTKGKFIRDFWVTIFLQIVAVGALVLAMASGLL